MTADIGHIIDLETYPIADKRSALRDAIVTEFRDQLDTRQYCVLPDFLRPVARAELIDEVVRIMPRAHRNSSSRNCYLQRTPDPEAPETHPARTIFEASYRMLAYDLFEDSSHLRALYAWQPFRAFVADVTGSGTLHPSEDPYQPANVICYGDGDNSAWHFDSTSAFTMTLMLQTASAGGDFEIAPNTRTLPPTDPDPEHDKLRAVLSGDRAHVIQVPREPGALVIFRGSSSVHRVTTVSGDRDRLMAVMVYENRPGVVGDPEVNRTVYGPRTTAAAG